MLDGPFLPISQLDTRLLLLLGLIVLGLGIRSGSFSALGWACVVLRVQFLGLPIPLGVRVKTALKILAAAAGATATGGSGVVAVVSDHTAPLLGPLKYAVPALLAGATVVLKPSPKTPAAAFALAELSARSGFPGGVFNLLHGDLAAVEGLCADDDVSLLLFAGEPALGSKVATIATRHGKPFID